MIPDKNTLKGSQLINKIKNVESSKKRRKTICEKTKENNHQKGGDTYTPGVF